MNPRKIPSTYRPRSHHKGITVAHGDRNSTERSPGFEVPTPHLCAVGSLIERVEMTQAKDILRMLQIHKRCVARQCRSTTLE
ncbi:hypothetical protein L208DRAFT_1403885 [Tricholoma matsutake]|nr:hypothetical protein L208DRAFT_1403885 [Tricholoma matsutake 945]